MLPTLLLWRSQLRAAREWAAEQNTAQAADELAASEYEWLCAPALDGAAYWGGGWTVALGLSALLGFVAALLRFHPEQAAAG